MRLAILFFIILVTAKTVNAEPIPSEQNLYPNMVRFTMQGLINTCKAVDSGIGPEYDSEFAAWEARHADTLKEQDKYAANKIEADGKSTLEHVKSKSDAIVADIKKMGTEKQIRSCRKLFAYFVIE